jgi:hypothetical protein
MFVAGHAQGLRASYPVWIAVTVIRYAIFRCCCAANNRAACAADCCANKCAADIARGCCANCGAGRCAKTTADERAIARTVRLAPGQGKGDACEQYKLFHN